MYPFETNVYLTLHIDYYGNEQADELARMESDLDISNAVLVTFPLGNIKGITLSLSYKGPLLTKN